MVLSCLRASQVAVAGLSPPSSAIMNNNNSFSLTLTPDNSEHREPRPMPPVAGHLLRVPGKDQATMRPQSRTRSADYFGSAAASNLASGHPSRSACSSLTSLWHSAYSFETSHRPPSSSLGSTNISFCSASESNVPAATREPISKDFLISQDHNTHQQPQAHHPDQHSGAHSNPSSGTTNQSSFYCRGLSSSQVTPANSRSQPSDQSPSQQLSQSDSHSSPEADQQQLTSTDPHSIIHACNQVGLSSPQSDSSSNSTQEEDDPHQFSFEVTRKPASHHQDRLAIKPKANHSDDPNSSRTSITSVGTLIPTSIQLADTTGPFRCPFVRRMLSTFGSDFVSFNQKRKKVQSELVAKVRIKFQPDQQAHDSPKKSPSSSSSTGSSPTSH